MKIKIIVAPYMYNPIHHMFPHVQINPLPYGAGSIVSFLRRHGYSIAIEDISAKMNNYETSVLLSFSNKKMIADMEDYLIRDKPNRKIANFVEEMFRYVSYDNCDLIGFSLFSRMGLPCSLLLAKAIKERTSVPIVFGGALVTQYAMYKLWDSLLEKHRYIDYIIFGEGEIPMLRFVEYLQGAIEIDGVPNLIYRDKGKVIKSTRKFFDIEDASIPEFDDLPFDRQVQIDEQIQSQRLRTRMFSIDNIIQLPYQITRGCTQRCSFCNYHLVTPRVEFKSHHKVIIEIRQLKEKYKNNHFYFCECRINLSYRYLEELCDLFMKDKLNIAWATIASVNNMDRNLLMKMKLAGCYRVSWGIESGSDKILVKMRKGFSASQAAQVLKDSHEVGMANFINLITGIAGETGEDVNQTIKFVRNNVKYIDKIRIFDFVLSPRTLIYDQPEDYGIENIAFDYRSHLGFIRLKFDEIGGLKWQEKLKQKRIAYKKVQREIHRIFSRKLCGNKMGILDRIFYE